MKSKGLGLETIRKMRFLRRVNILLFIQEETKENETLNFVTLSDSIRVPFSSI